ncbi:MAG: AAA family ATPase [Candidatus Omnitrophota bacterium]
MSFQDIVGQDKIINYLLGAYKNDRIYQSYLFYGPQAIGKLELARNFAKLLNCQDNQYDACDHCSSCIKINNNNHPDIHFIGPDLTGFISIEAVRNLGRAINLRPFEARKNVFIISDAHCLTDEAQNGLLKAIEEPTKDAIIILITSRIDLLFATIISRCQRLRFSALGPEKLKEVIKRKHLTEERYAHFLAYFSEGSLKEANKYMDTKFLYYRDKIIGFVLRPRSLNLEGLLDDFRDKEKARDLLKLLVSIFRDLLLLKIGLSLDHLINIDKIQVLSSLKDKYSKESLEQIISDTFSLNNYIEQNINFKMALNWLSLRMSPEEDIYERAGIS